MQSLQHNNCKYLPTIVAILQQLANSKGVNRKVACATSALFGILHLPSERYKCKFIRKVSSRTFLFFSDA